MTNSSVLVQTLEQVSAWAKNAIGRRHIRESRRVLTWSLTAGSVSISHMSAPLDSNHAKLEFAHQAQIKGQKIADALDAMGAFDRGLGEWDLTLETNAQGDVGFFWATGGLALHPQGGRSIYSTDVEMTGVTISYALHLLARVPICQKTPRALFLVGKYRLLAPDVPSAAAIALIARDPQRLHRILEGKDTGPEIEVFRLQSGNAIPAILDVSLPQVSP